MLRTRTSSIFRLALLVGLTCPMAVWAADPADPAVPTAPDATAKPTLTVKVTDADEKPLSGATVEVKAAKPTKPGKHAATDFKVAGVGLRPHSGQADGGSKPAKPPAKKANVTDDSGTLVLKDQADGTYTVTVRLKGYAPNHEDVTIADGKDASVTIVLKSTTPVKKMPTK